MCLPYNNSYSVNRKRKKTLVYFLFMFYLHTSSLSQPTRTSHSSKLRPPHLEIENAFFVIPSYRPTICAHSLRRKNVPELFDLTVRNDRYSDSFLVVRGRLISSPKTYFLALDHVGIYYLSVAKFQLSSSLSLCVCVWGKICREIVGSNKWFGDCVVYVLKCFKWINLELNSTYFEMKIKWILT